MLEIVLKFWYLWLLILLGAAFKLFKPTIKGWLGEKTVSAYLSMLPKEGYILINDLILSTESGTTQIDHVVVSLYGVFVIETKNYKGWIFGSENSAQWIENIYGNKSRFMNPIHQNYAHIKAIEARLTKHPKIPIIPIVAFSSNCDLKVKTKSPVVYFHRICSTIRRYKDRVLENADIANIANLLQAEDINGSAAKKEHIERIENKKEEVQNAKVGGKCPKCAGTLVERRGRYGGFIGCSYYPKCKFTKQI